MTHVDKIVTLSRNLKILKRYFLNKISMYDMIFQLAILIILFDFLNKNQR